MCKLYLSDVGVLNNILKLNINDILNDNISLYKGIIPVEVKASDRTQSKSLNVYSEVYKPKYLIRISMKEFGYNPDTRIKSVPLYATFLIK